ncbi:unnamed protein product [Urochloa humidicola]
MAPSLKMASLVAVLLLLVATPQARGWAAEGHRVWDMVPGRTRAEQAIPGDAAHTGTMVPSSYSFCSDTCRCYCSGSNPESCHVVTCSSTLTCDATGSCKLTEHCGSRC